MSFLYNDPRYGYYPTGFYQPQQWGYPRRQQYSFPMGYDARRRPRQPSYSVGFNPDMHYHNPTRSQEYGIQEQVRPEGTNGKSTSKSIPVRVTSPVTKESPVENNISNATSKAKNFEGASLASSPKQYSVASVNTLTKLEKLSAQHSALVSMINDIEQNTDCTCAESVLEAKHRLAQLAGDIDSLQFSHLDAIETAALQSGKQEARTQRKELNQSVERLQQRVQELYKRFSDIATDMAIAPQEDATSPSSAPEESGDTARAESPLESDFKDEAPATEAESYTDADMSESCPSENAHPAELERAWYTSAEDNMAVETPSDAPDKVVLPDRNGAKEESMEERKVVTPNNERERVIIEGGHN